MQNPDLWHPTKYVYKSGRLSASKDPKEVHPASSLITNIVSSFYQKNLSKYAKGRLLDLGCGKVPLYLAYKDHVSENMCVDWSHTLHKNPYLDLECDLTRPLPFPDEDFDTIILSDVLEHIPEPTLLWGEMARLLRPKGVVIMNVPFYYPLHETPHDYYRYTEFALRRFVESAKLNVVYIEAVGGSLEVIADIVGKNVSRVPFIGTATSRLIQSLAWLTVRGGIGKKISDKTKGTFPLGYFLVAQR